MVVEWDQFEDIHCLQSEFYGRIESGDVSVKTRVPRLRVRVSPSMNRSQQLEIGLALLERESVVENFLQQLYSFRAWFVLSLLHNSR